ncbi:MAG: winged helix-turn-helix transcriptional regulator [Alphaproteobacteria bacterium]|nr:winged helix-turn-helix transcriptional regulator [Alphaproteobacteria bacterium]
MNPLTLDQMQELAGTFRLLGDPTRLAILLAVAVNARPVGAVAEGLRQSPSLVSHHLRLLRAARLVRAERQGKQVFYALADEHVRTVIADMAAHVRETHAEH